MATQDRPPAPAGIWGLFDTSASTEVHTSASALAGFLAGVAALLSAPFSIMFAVALYLALIGVVLALVGVATTSRAGVAGRALSPFGLLFALVALALLGLRYLNLDSAFGDALAPTLREMLDRLNAQVGAP